MKQITRLEEMARKRMGGGDKEPTFFYWAGQEEPFAKWGGDESRTETEGSEPDVGHKDKE